MKNRLFFYVSVAIPLLLFIYFFQQFAINVPYSDDYWAIYDNLWQEKLHSDKNSKTVYNYLLDANQEHIIAYTKGLSVFLYKILQENFSLVHLMVLGNIAFLLTIFILGYFFKQNNNPTYSWLALFPLFGISLQMHENTFWSMAASQNFTVLFFSVLSLYFVLKNGLPNLLFGSLFALLGTLTSSPSLLMMLISCGLLFFQKRYQTFLLFVFFTIFAGIFLYLQVPNHSLDFPENISFLNIFRFVGAFAHFNGNDFFNQNFPVFIGIIVVFSVFFYFLKQKNYEKTNLFFFGIVFFVILVGISVGLKREDVLLSRYKIYSVLGILGLIPIIYKNALGKSRKIWFTIFLVGGLSYQIFSWLIYPYEARKFYEMRISEIYNRQNNHVLTAQFQSFCNNAYYLEIMEALKLKAPKIDEIEQIHAFLQNFEPVNLFNTKENLSDLKIVHQLKIEKNTVGCLIKPLNLSCQLNDEAKWDEKYFLLMTSAKKHYLFSFYPQKNTILKQISGRNYFDKTLSQTVYSQYLEPQKYRFSIIKYTENKIYLFIIDEKYNISL